MTGFAEIAVKDLGSGKVEITFTYKDDKASEMGAIGSFNSWTVPGTAMTRNGANLWEITVPALATDEIQYKFYSNGSWIVDAMSPDKKDDGYGGTNGLIIVADILSGVTPAVPGVAPVAVKTAVKAAVGGRQKVSFGTMTYLESDTTFDTGDKKFKPLGTALNAKSVWKFNGDLVAGMPGRIEITTYNGHSKIIDKGGIEAADGLQNLAAGLVFNPLYYLGGNKKPSLDKFSFGFDTPFLVYETGYVNSLLPAHKNLLWDTVVDTQLANDGYSSFALGTKLKNIGDVAIDAAIVPNKSQTGFFGMYGFTSAEAGIVKAEVQYEMLSSNKTEEAKIFKDLAQQNILAGASASMDGFTLTAQGLVSSYLKDSPGDKVSAKEKVALSILFGYADYYETWGANARYDYRGGLGAKMLYADNAEVIGLPATQKADLNGFYKIGYWFTGKGDLSAVLATEKPLTVNIPVMIKPGVIVNLETLKFMPLTVEVATQFCYDTKPIVGDKSFNLKWAGAKLAFGALVPGVLDGIDVYYKMDRTNKDVMFNSLLSEFNLAHALKAQAGFGLRSGTGVVNALGFALGVNYVLPIPAAKTPVVYSQFVYNMDPYNEEGSYTYDITDFGPDNGIAGSDGTGALRFGMKWDF